MKLILVAAPSGAGKSSFVNRACREDARLKDVITYTTRERRKGEVEGDPYHYISHEEFQRRIDAGFFAEFAKVHVNMYGTSKDSLVAAEREGRWGIMDIDVQGTRTLRAKYPEAKTIFIMPPSIDVLRQRIEKRDGGKPKDLEIRMKNAEREMALAHEFDKVIVNDDFETSFAEFKKVIEAWLGPR